MNNVLHLHAGSSFHVEGHIVGDREALIRLRKAIDRAISTGKGAAPVSVNDGEGYTCFVLCVPEELTDGLAVPYTSEDALIGSKYPDPNTTICPTGVPNTFCTWNELNKLNEQAWDEKDNENQTE